jgi:hypothetical protein
MNTLSHVTNRSDRLQPSSKWVQPVSPLMLKSTTKEASRLFSNNNLSIKPPDLSGYMLHGHVPSDATKKTARYLQHESTGLLRWLGTTNN